MNIDSSLLTDDPTITVKKSEIPRNDEIFERFSPDIKRGRIVRLETDPSLKEIASIQKTNVEEERLSQRKAMFLKYFGLANSTLPSKIEYSVINGTRYLDAYWAPLHASVKERWFGREISEVFTTEFLVNKKFYPEAAIRSGRIFINRKQVIDPHYKLRNGDKLLHLGHRHEGPILDFLIQIIENNEDWLVVNKPPGLPVHPCGMYNLHSVTSLLRNEYGFDNLRPCHRLDRTTSGVLIFARNLKTDLKFKNACKDRRIYKEYITKVDGIFPDGEIVCDLPIEPLTASIGIRQVKHGGAYPSKSTFKRLYANKVDDTSLVSCKIETGRTHQIRVHLQYLGFPVVADNMYNHEVWGPMKGKDSEYGKPHEQLVEDVKKKCSSSNWHESIHSGYEDRLREIAMDEKYQPEHIALDDLRLDDRPTYDPICLGCNVVKKVPTMDDFRIMLHCWRYRGDDWEFVSPLPDWASPLSFLEEESKSVSQPG